MKLVFQKLVLINCNLHVKNEIKTICYNIVSDVYENKNQKVIL